MEIIALISLFICIALVLIKTYNLLSLGTIYDNKLNLILFVVMLFCWILYFTNFMFQAQALETVSKGADIWEISNNDYLELSFYFNVINFTVLIGFFLTMAELLTFYSKQVIQPRKREVQASTRR